MVKELRRFAVRLDDEPPFEVVEVATFRVGGAGAVVQDGTPTLLTYSGSEVFATGQPGEYRVERTGQVVREVS